MNIQCQSCSLLDVFVDGIVYPWHRHLLPWWLNPSSMKGQAAQILHSAGQTCFNEFPVSLPVAAAYCTSAGELSYRYRGIVHVVSAGLFGVSSPSIVQQATENALWSAQEAGLTSLAFPVSGNEFGHMSQDEVLPVVLQTLRRAATTDKFQLERVVLCMMGYSVLDTLESPSVYDSYASFAC